MQTAAIDLKSWQPPSSIVEAAASGALAPDACVIVWNPCDGHHLYRLSEHSAERIAAEALDGFGTHWCGMPDGPDEAPGDWLSLDDLEEAYGETIALNTMILLWSPTGAHRIAWLLHDGPWTLAEEGRRGLYAGWRLPPAQPAE